MNANGRARTFMRAVPQNSRVHSGKTGSDHRGTTKKNERSDVAFGRASSANPESERTA